MALAYAGGPVEQVALGQYTLQKKDIAHHIVDYLGEQYGYGTVLLVLAVGAVVVFRRRILTLLKGGSSSGK